MFSQSYYPSRYTQPSPRDKYLAALAQAKAAEQEFLAAEAIEQEERLLRRRLEELQLQRQEVSLPSYGAPDRLALLRLQLQQQEQAQAELLRQREEEAALAALQLEKERQQRAQLELILEQRRKEQDRLRLLNSLRSQAPTPTRMQPRACVVPKVKIPAVGNDIRSRSQPSSQLTVEDLLQHLVAHRTPELKPESVPSAVAPQSQTAAIEQALKAIYPHISLRQPQVEVPTTSAPVQKVEKLSTPAPTNASSAENAVSLEQVLKSLFGDSIQIKANTSGSSAPASSQATPERKMKPSSEPVQTQFVPVEVKPASSSTAAPNSKTEEPAKPATPSFSSTDAAAGLEQILIKSLFGDAVTVKVVNPNEGPKPSSSSQAKSTPQVQPVAPHPEPQRPKSPVSSLKEQLEARLASDESTEVKDTIQAIFNSLSDATPSAPTPSAATTNDASSSKGKAKAEPAPATVDTASSDLATSLATVNSIETAYRSLVDEFTFPAHLDFTPIHSPASSDTEQSLTSRLAYTARNAPLRYYEQALSGLLAKLDSVESFGHEELRAKRKEVVGLVEGALEDLEREVEGRWRVKAAKERKVVVESVSTEDSHTPVEVTATPAAVATSADAPVEVVTPADVVAVAAPVEVVAVDSPAEVVAIAPPAEVLSVATPVETEPATTITSTESVDSSPAEPVESLLAEVAPIAAEGTHLPETDVSVPVIEEEIHDGSSSDISAPSSVEVPIIEEPEEALEDSILIEDDASDLADSESNADDEAQHPDSTAVKSIDEALSIPESEKKVVDDAGSDWSEVEA